MPKLRQLAFSGEIISEDTSAQVHWIQKADGRKNHTIKLDVKSMKAYDRWYDCWYSYEGEDDIYDEDFEDPRWFIEEICEVKIADHGGNEFLDEKMYGGYSFEEDYFGLLVQISDRRRYGVKERLALVCREDFEPIEENQKGEPIMKTDRIYKFQIRQDLIDEGLNVPIIWIEKSYPCQCFDTREVSMTTEKGETITQGFKDFGPHFLEHTETLEVEESFPEEMDEIITEDGYNTIISITDPEHDWIDRKALAYSIDFQSYDESDPRVKEDPIEIFIPHGAWLAPQKVVTEEGSVWIWKLVGWKDEVYCDSKGHQENIEGEIRINLQANTAGNLIEEIQEENHA